MKIILLKDVGGVGQQGMVKDVADGYGLNFLIARGLAIQATPQKIAEHSKRISTEKAEAQAKDAQLVDAVHKLDGARVVMKAKANAQGHLFKGIHKKELADTLLDAAFALDPDTILVAGNAIKEVGEHVVHIAVGGAEAAITLVVESL